MNEPRTDYDFSVVALVASAGGLEALTRVLAPLPADFPAAIIGLQHQMR
jgi:two-component system chemotaxis response regulator CheB